MQILINMSMFSNYWHVTTRHVRYIPQNMWQNLSLFAIHGTPIIVIQLMTVAKIKISPQNSAALNIKDVDILITVNSRYTFISFVIHYVFGIYQSCTFHLT